MIDSLIFDWNRIGAPARPSLVMLDDETLRDGLQSPSVRTPTIEQKVRILHLIDALGIDTADIGLPGAGPHVVRDVERLASEIVSARALGQGQLRRPHPRPATSSRSPRSSQRTGLPIECCAFIGSSPIRQFTEGWTLDWLLRNTEDAISFAVKEGPRRDVRHRGHHACQSRDAAGDLHAAPSGPGAKRICVADTVGHATPAGASAVVRFAGAGDSRNWAPTSASTGTATAIATWRSSTASRRSRPAPTASTAPRSASASASATRRWTCCWSTSC